MMGEILSSLTEEVQDTVGELANIVAGGAGEEFAETGISHQISNPTVVVGKNHANTHKGGTPVVAIPFKLEKNPFFVEISMKLMQ